MRRTAVERGKDADNAPLLLGGQGRGRARYLNFHIISFDLISYYIISDYFILCYIVLFFSYYKILYVIFSFFYSSINLHYVLFCFILLYCIFHIF